METLAAFFALGIIALVMTNHRFVRVGGSLFLGLAAASGMPFLILGMLLGPSGLGVLSSVKVAGLRPLLTLGMGAAGLLFALNLQREILRKITLRIYLASFAQAVVTAILVAAPVAGFLRLTTDMALLSVAGTSMLVGASASISASHLPLLWQRWGRLPQLQSLSLVVVATLDDFVGVFTLAIAICLVSARSLPAGALFLGMAILAGLVGALLMVFLAAAVRGTSELVAVVLGGVALIAGSCGYLRLSSMIGGVICGITLLFVSSDLSTTVHGLLSRAERSIFVLLLFLIGLHVNLHNGAGWIAALAVVVTRVVGKILGGQIARKIAGADLVLPRDPGLALIAYGPLALCITADYALLVTGRSTHWILDVAAFAALGSELIAASLFRLSIERLTPATEPKRASVA